jgi:glucosamine--fructose-6-phosphate aminotransferase (isomerizing)
MSDPTTNGFDPFLAEILAQPDAIRSAADGLLEQVDDLDRLRRILSQADQPIVMTGMGSSYDSLLGLASVLGRAGVQTLTINTAELVNFQMATLRPGVLVIVVSQSGRSAEVVRLAAELPERPGVGLVSITNGLDNPLALAADLAMDMHAGHEIGPATMTFAATLVVLCALAHLITDTAHNPAQIARQTADLATQAAHQMEHQLADHAALAQAVAAWAHGRPNVAIVGRGVGLATAELGALVLKEAAQCAAQSMDAAEFRHGPLELAGPNLAVAVICLEPATLALDRRLIADLLSRGSSVMAVGLADPKADAWRLTVETSEPLLAAAVAAAPIQMLAWTLAAARHPVPGQFSVGSKVTTQE